MQRLINYNLRDIGGTKQGPYMDSCAPPPPLLAVQALIMQQRL